MYWLVRVRYWLERMQSKLQESLQVIAAGETQDRCKRLHRKTAGIETGEFSKVREAFVIAAFGKISLGGRSFGENHFMAFEHHVEVFDHLPVCRRDRHNGDPIDEGLRYDEVAIDKFAFRRKVLPPGDGDARCCSDRCCRAMVRSFAGLRAAFRRFLA